MIPWRPWLAPRLIELADDEDLVPSHGSPPLSEDGYWPDEGWQRLAAQTFTALGWLGLALLARHTPGGS